MKIETILRSSILTLALVLTLIARSAPAATHTITFGSNFQYTPATLNVAVGDVITWEGDFSMHPLRFDAVPNGATKPADITSGTTFSYTVEVAGGYAYHCLLHGAPGSGMAGGFIAGTARVDDPVSVKMLSVSPNPVFTRSAMNVELGFDGSSVRGVEICDMQGSCWMLLSGAGNQIEGSKLTITDVGPQSGAYVLAISTTNGDIYRRKLIITR